MRYAKDIGQLTAAEERPDHPNQPYVTLGELGGVDALALRDAPMPLAVVIVFRRGAPPQIAKGIMLAISIVVQALHAKGAWADERFENKAMNRAIGTPTRGRQGNDRIAPIDRWLQNSPLVAQGVRAPIARLYQRRPAQ